MVINEAIKKLSESLKENYIDEIDDKIEIYVDWQSMNDEWYFKPFLHWNSKTNEIYLEVDSTNVDEIWENSHLSEKISKVEYLKYVTEITALFNDKVNCIKQMDFEFENLAGSEYTDLPNKIEDAKFVVKLAHPII